MVIDRVGQVLERVAIGVIAGARPGMDPSDTGRWLATRPPALRRAIIAGIIVGLFAVSLVFAQWGWLGIAVYLALVVWLIG